MLHLNHGADSRCAHTAAASNSSRSVTAMPGRSCPVRARCTTAENGRTIRLHLHHDLLAAARAQA